jgi:hypothetical protein
MPEGIGNPDQLWQPLHLPSWAAATTGASDAQSLSTMRALDYFPVGEGFATPNDGGIWIICII